jgi:hypothetical protein
MQQQRFVDGLMNVKLIVRSTVVLTVGGFSSLQVHHLQEWLFQEHAAFLVSRIWNCLSNSPFDHKS